MSMAPSGNPSDRSRCYKYLWRLFPHVFLILSLIVYAALGAVVFSKIEGGRDVTDQKTYQDFITALMAQKNASGVDTMLKKDLKALWLQDPKKWTLYGSLFFCCTVFTTVGYGEIYPVTMPGKVMCVLYAMVGIPLMLLVITDVGDIMARLFSKGYHHLHKLLELLRRKRAMADGMYTFSHEVVVREPLDIKQVIRTQASVKRRSVKLFNNREIFEQLITREKLGRSAPLLRSRSCPELNRSVPGGSTLWDGIGDDMDRLNVPLLLILLVVFAYIFLGGLVLRLWEDQLTLFDSFYFCFITLTTIGFGDIVPLHPNFFMLTFIFIISGMAIMSMAFKLGQSSIISCYRRLMRCISRGRVKYEATQDD